MPDDFSKNFPKFGKIQIQDPESLEVSGLSNAPGLSVYIVREEEII